MKRTLAVLALAGATSWAAFAQSGGKSYSPPRLPDGKPDMNGIWQGPAEVNKDIQAAKIHGKKVIIDPANGKIPYLPAALAQKEKNYKTRKTADPMDKCFMPGTPRLMYISDPYFIAETPGFFAVMSQFMHEVRGVPIDGSKHLQDIDFWQGDPRGSWDGDTFVIDSTDFNDKTWLDSAGDYHSDQLHVVERFTRTGPTTITYQATLTDPKVFSKPWTMQMPLTLNTKRNAELLEDECNYKLEGPTVTEGTRPDPHRESKNQGAAK